MSQKKPENYKNISELIMPKQSAYSQLNKYINMGRVVRIAKYIRCSSDDQKKNGYTIGDQLALLDDFAAENGLICYDNYIDEGISATLEIHKRKALAQLIKDAQAGKFDIIIFKCIDRFFRNVGEYYECQKQLSKAGVTWISIEESDLDPDNDDAVFKINIYLAMAEYEARKTSKRILFNNKNRIKNKQVITGSQNFLFPWTVVGEPRNKRLAKDMDRATELYDMLDYYEIHQSKAKLLAYYNLKYDKNMSMQTLTNLLNDTLLYGEYKGISDFVEPYITKERFDRIQEIIKNNARHNKKHNSVFLFSGLIVCSSCGCKMTGNSYTRVHTKGYIYRCNKARIQKTCDFSMSVNEKTIEKQLLDNLERYIKTTLVTTKNIENKKQNKPKKNRSESIKKEMARLNSMYRKGRINEEEYDKEYLQLENDLKIAEIDEGEPDKGKDISHLVELLNSDWRGLYNQLDKPHKKAFWRKTIKKFSVDSNKNIIDKSIIFF